MAQGIQTSQKKRSYSVFFGLALLASVFAFPYFSLGQTTSDQSTNATLNANANSNINASLTTSPTATTPEPTPDQINADIEARRQKILDLQKQVEQFQKGIDVKQKEEFTLQNQIVVLEGQINKTTLEIEGIGFEIENKEQDIQQLQTDIGRNERKIGDERDELGSLLRQIQKYDSRTSLEIVLGHDSFNEFFDQVRYVEELQSSLRQHLTNLVVARDEMQAEQDRLKVRRDELIVLQDQLEATQKAIDQEKDYHAELLADTKLSEQKFNDLLQQSVNEQKAAESEVVSLQQQLTQKIQQGGGTDQPALSTSVSLTWPITPSHGISAYFHDPDYVFRKYFEHPGIDIPTPQGTPIAAPADGYVARAKQAGLGYSYIMVIHSDKIATVYGHVSRIDVSEDTYVKKGQIIGMSGGLPGTTGAGRLTTGPHLHFEVRVEGIPVNPLDYLPKVSL